MSIRCHRAGYTRQEALKKIFICFATALFSLIGTELLAQAERNPILQRSNGGHIVRFHKRSVSVGNADHAVTISFVDSQPVMPESPKPNDADPGLINVTYTDLWKGVSLAYVGGRGVFESIYRLSPHPPTAKRPVDDIRLRYSVPVTLDGNGNIVLTFQSGQMTESAPLAWQEHHNQRVSVPIAFRVFKNGDVGFQVGTYDPTIPLMIDPVLDWHTYVGSSSMDDIGGIARDPQGYLYVVGIGEATWGTPVNLHDEQGNNFFVAKFDSNGNEIWNTFLGGDPLGNYRPDIAVDSSGNCYIVGTSSDSVGTPIRQSSLGHEIIVAKFDTNGNRMWHTYMGSTGTDIGANITLDDLDNIYIVGTSDYNWGAPLVEHGSYSFDEAVVAKLSSNGELLWHTYLGPNTKSYGRSVAVGSDGNVYVGGEGIVLPDMTSTTCQESMQGGFIAKLSSAGLPLSHTCIPSVINGIAFGPMGNIYAVGYSDQWGTPLNPHAGSDDVIVAKFSSSGTLMWHTFLGSSSVDYGKDIIVDDNGVVTVSGYGGATWGNPDNPFAGVWDALVAQTDDNGNLLWNTFMGSASYEIAWDIIDNPLGGFYIVGSAYGDWGAPLSEFKGLYCDGFLACFTTDELPACLGDFDDDGDLDGEDLAAQAADGDNPVIIAEDFAAEFGRTDCP
nr:SBBP repeat-containing protein [uncultured Desulfobacter sp.]